MKEKIYFIIVIFVIGFILYQSYDMFNIIFQHVVENMIANIQKEASYEVLGIRG